MVLTVGTSWFCDLTPIRDRNISNYVDKKLTVTAFSQDNRSSSEDIILPPAIIVSVMTQADVIVALGRGQAARMGTDQRKAPWPVVVPGAGKKNHTSNYSF